MDRAFLNEIEGARVMRAKWLDEQAIALRVAKESGMGWGGVGQVVEIQSV